MAAAVAVAVLSGCGGDSEAASLTKAEYVEQANEICAERKQEWDSALASYRKEAQNAGDNVKLQRELAEKALADSMLPALKQQLESFEDLGAPEGKEKQAEKMVKSLSEAVQEIEKKGTQAVGEYALFDFEKEAEALGVNCLI